MSNRSVNFSRLGMKAAGVVAAAFALSAGSALADTVTVTNYTYGANDSVANNLGGDNPAIATQIDVSTTSVGTLDTYCTDLFDYIYSGTTYTYTREALAAGEGYVTASNDTFGKNWTQTQVNLLTALLDNGSIAANNINTAAVQVAIWEIEYGTETSNAFNVLANFGQGSVGVTDATLTAAQTYLNDVTSGAWSSAGFSGYTVEYLTAPITGGSTQPLLYLASNTTNFPQGNPPAVPEPATIGVLGMGLLGLAYARRRKMI